MLLHLHNEPFQAIKNKTKNIEVRVNDEKRRKLKEGQIIEFQNRSTNEILKTKIIKLHLFPTFTESYAAFPKESLGYQKDEEANPYDMEKYYSKEEQEKYGVVGIEIEVIDE